MMKGQVVFLFVGIFQAAYSQSRRNQARANNGLEVLMSGIGDDSDAFSMDLFSYSPTTPRPDEVNCFVEIPSTRVGGRCVRLGRFRRPRLSSVPAWGCQSGIHLDIGSPDCSADNRRRRRMNRRSRPR